MADSFVLADALFDGLLCAAFLAVAALPAWFGLQQERQRLSDPAFLRTAGVVLESPTALDSASGLAGYYMGAAIYGELYFKGVRYVFDRIVPAGCERLVASRELYLAPGLVYVAA